MPDSEENHFAVGQRADLREVVNWQQERYHHVQLLSQGFLASSLTILAVVATVFTAIGEPSLSFPIPESPQGPEYVGLVATRIIIGFSYLVWLALGILSAMMFFVSVWKFIELVLERPLLSEKELPDTFRGDSVYSIFNGVGGEPSG